MIITRIIQNDKPFNVRQVITLLETETEGGFLDEFLSEMTINALIELHIQNEEYRFLFKYMKEPQVKSVPLSFPAGTVDQQ